MAAPVIWITDDSPLEAERSRRVLANASEVRVFHGGAALLEGLATDAVPDAVILDWQMPDVSGLEVCRFVRKTYDRFALPILVLTITLDEKELVGALAAGADDFVTKPCSPVVLRARLQTLIERKRLAQELQVESTLRERFIGILGHDLRQPLSTFVLGTHLLAESPLGDTGRRTIGRLTRAAEQMERMVSDILDLTRGRAAGGIPIVRTRVDVGAICADLIEDLHQAHPNRMLALSTSGDTSGQFDAGRITQLCSNLVGNALQYGAASEPIRVLVDGQAQAVHVRVENGGNPIPPALVARLFDPFRRGDSVGGRGLGLGLFIVREIAVGHGGDVRVESDTTSTRFYVTLPRHSEDASPGGPVAAVG